MVRIQFFAVKVLLMLSASFLLFGCGGGGGGDDGDTGGNASPNALYVNAGADIEMLEGATSTLSGSVTGNTDGATWRWSASPAATITQADNTTSEAEFTAPTVTTDTAFVITVVVTNSSGNSDTDTLNILVRPQNIAPVAVIEAEPEEGQPANTYSAGRSVTLNGRASIDDDAPDPDNPIAAWEWQQTAGNSVLNDVTTDASTLTITMPVEAEAQTLTFTLTVTDAEGTTDTASLSLNTLSESQTLPLVEAGADQAVFSGERVVLNGTATTTVASGLPLISEWDGMLDGVVSPSSLSTYAIAPQVQNETVFTYMLSVTDAYGHVVTDEVDITVRPYPVPLINDTGVTVQANNTAYANTQQNAFPGQDGQRGSDVIHAANLLEKAGRGKAGFDFTKLNANGDEEDDTAQAWDCVRDNVTGLVWEKKTTDGGVRDANHTYTWFFFDENGGYQGVQSGTDASCTLTSCNTTAYVSAVNAVGLCGFYDWRMPTYEEMMSLIHFGLASGVRVDDDYFPNSGTVDGDGRLWYWTRIPSADGVAEDAAQNAWALDFASGLDNFLNKATPGSVRLVRAGR
ncbi:DUF1566 domain-containing protein [Alteromonas confluentis]|uniref:Lcl C-terminal domain-containing protein n=1 Tax=Alteromonas confluentis TaxID=1656094 RepID=A0A1E7Z6A6_9ALTE|nr:DUF1566 domain-containing protein [Alteromonas confluentis]OFC69065.1 hypothetical protein BFC18_20225 [Alteromonas confluentis]